MVTIGHERNCVLRETGDEITNTVLDTLMLFTPRVVFVINNT